jgi:acylphosphatase
LIFPLLLHPLPSGERVEVREDFVLVVMAAKIAMEKVRVRVIVEGRVQGVFFRHHTQETAFELGVKGWVKNRRDGCVEAVFEGDREKVNQIIQWCHRGPSEAKVRNVSVTMENYTGEFEEFYVTY